MALGSQRGRARPGAGAGALRGPAPAGLLRLVSFCFQLSSLPFTDSKYDFFQNHLSPNIVFKRNKISGAVLKDPFEMLFLEWKFE